ncbi:MAG: amino acid decarboxylase, partial [Oscillospiraceae bacterium]|nr:amino acid decarboxylase [Oscillospiraceae bacterium]
EFADPDYLVLMFSSETHEEELRALEEALRRIPIRPAVQTACPLRRRREPEYSLREVLLHPFESVPVRQAVGRILASPSVSCPPAVPICLCGERRDREALEMFEYYGITHCDVLLEQV